MIGYCFEDVDIGDLVDYVVEVFDVLYVEGGVDIDFGVQQFIDVLLVFGMV